MRSLVWDQHTCPPLQTDADVDTLTRYRRDGGAFVSVNAGYAPHSFADTTALLKHYRAAVDAHPDLELVTGIDDVGISTDFSFDYADAVDELTGNAHLFAIGPQSRRTRHRCATNCVHTRSAN